MAKKLHEVTPNKCGPGKKYLLDTVQKFQYFDSKYLKRTFKKKLHEIESSKYDPRTKYLLNTVQQIQHFAFKYLKWTFEKSHIKSDHQI